MSTTDVSVAELTDPELITRVREGDVDAYGTLFSRHVDAATRLARMLVGGPDADDLVSDAFVKVLNVLLGGGGPDLAFRAYLLTAVRRLHVDKIRSNQRLTTTGDMTPFDPGVPFTDTAVAGFEGGAAAKAFASLPERWQMVLWHLEVENQKPADIAPLLGMSPNSVSALAYRAREGLRQAFLTMHAGDLVGADCEETRGQLGGYVRGGLSKRESAKVEDHLEHCRPCTAVYLELVDVNSSLAGWLAPALLGAAAASYLGTGATAGGAGLGVMGLAGRARDFVVANGQVAAAAAVAVGVAGVATLVVVTGGPDDRPAAADPPKDPTTSDVKPAEEPSAPDRGAPTRIREGTTVRAPGTGPTASGSAEPEVESVPAAVAPAPGRDVAGSATDRPPEQAGQPSVEQPTRPGSRPGSGTDPGPGPGPAPGPDPGPDPEPEPSEPPQSPPPSSPPPPTPPSADVRVAASLGLRVGNRVVVTVVVLGVPSGSTATMRISSDRGNMRRIAAPGCSGGPDGYTCRVGPLRTVFVFDHRADGTGVGVEVSAAVGHRDPNTGNNTAGLRLPD